MVDCPCLNFKESIIIGAEFAREKKTFHGYYYESQHHLLKPKLIWILHTIHNSFDYLPLL